jgi:stage V sporulation protein G
VKGGITMEVTEVRVHLVGKDKVKAYVSITFDDAFVVRDLKIVQGDKGLFVTMPRRRLPDGTFRDTAHPLNKELRHVIEEKVLKEYERKQVKEQGEQIQSEGQKSPYPN